MPTSADGQVADARSEWTFDQDIDGWLRGSSDNWDVEVSWRAQVYEHQGVVNIPACNWAGNKFSWIEKKVSLPDGEKVQLQFSRHSAELSTLDKQWSDGLLRVVVKNASAQETAYEKVYSGPWSMETVDLSKYKGKTVIIRFENHGAGQVRLSALTSPACDGEDALIDDIRLIKDPASSAR
jgi:hypothetical protein